MDKLITPDFIKQSNRLLISMLLLVGAVVASFVFLFLLQAKLLFADSLSANNLYIINLSDLVTSLLNSLSLPAPRQVYISLASVQQAVFLFSVFCILAVLVMTIKLRRTVNRQAHQIASIQSQESTTPSVNQQIKESPTQAQKSSPIESDETEDNRRASDIVLAKTTQLALWQLPAKEQSKHQNQLISYVIGKPEQPIKSWRKLFNKADVATLVASAHQARLSKNTQHLELKTACGELVAIDINFQGASWFGTLRNISVDQKIRVKNTQLMAEREQLIRQQLLYDIEQSNKISEMIIRTMLQSQSVSIGSGITSWQVYRQLTRIFDWCRQTKIRAQLVLSPEQTKTDENIFHQLDGVALNVLSEVQLQRNQVFLSYDQQINPNAKFDVRLFNRLLVAVSRLLLVEQFNASLMIELGLGTQTGVHQSKQALLFKFSVKTAQPNKKIPPAIPLMLEEGGDYLPDVICYIHALMNTLKVSALALDSDEAGYQLSFQLQLDASEQNIKQSEPSGSIDFNQANMLYIGQAQSFNLLNVMLESANAKLSAVDDSQLEKIVNNELSVESLQKTPIELVLLEGNEFRQMFEQLNEYLQSLPNCIQPKLFVLQATHNANLPQQGLFDQACQPLYRQSLLLKLQQFLQADKPTNQLLSESDFDSFRFVPTQVELLLAVKEPQQHQTLIRLLNWLGLHVQVVSHGVSMSKYWQTGRYLLLVTEFEDSPFVEFSAGKSIKRAVFTFDNTQLSRLTKLQQGAEAEISTVEVLAEIQNLAQLVEQLSPWLKTKRTSPTVLPQVETSDSLASRLIGKLKKQAPSGDNAQVEQVTVIETTKDNGLASDCCDLEMFAENQGSPELAALMLSDYVQELRTKQQSFSQSLESNKQLEAIKLLPELLQTAKIISATNVIAVTIKLQQYFAEHESAAINGVVDDALIELDESLEQAITELELFDAYL